MADFTTPFITAAGTVLGATISATVPKLLDAQWFVRSKRASRENLQGIWIGSGKDFYVESGEDAFPFEVEMHFDRISGKRLRAEVNLTVPEYPAANTVLVLTGGFYNDDYLQFTYRGKTPARKQLGVVVLRLSDSGTEFFGHYAGFSPMRSCFVAGKVTLQKKHSY